jgi:16S rRNA G966 N2-methylase RsmD/transcriptional regulator with XRE-family HTH domain
MWSAGSAIRTRRESQGMSCRALAERLDVTTSFVSLVERGKRQLSENQARAVAEIFDLPAELLLLGGGKLPNDIIDAIRSDAAAVTAVVRQVTERDAVRYPNVPQMNLARKTEHRAISRDFLPDIPVRVFAKKASTSYRAHSYHTKVPPEAIKPFINGYTALGDLVCDPFCGSGMTGVAALQLGRRALLSDLSPAAVHIARNYTTYCAPKEIKRAYDRVAARVAATMAWLYRPLDGDRRNIEYTTWSDVFACPRCGSEIVYWNVDRQADKVKCQACARAAAKAELLWTGERPVEVHVARGASRIEARAPTEWDIALINDVASAPIPYWTPSAPFGPDREMWRASHAAMGINDAAHFFTRRNLHALAALRHAIAASSKGRVREALMFAFTASVNRASRRYQWNEKRPTNVMTGTLYISSLRYEWNVWSLFRRKVADVTRYFEAFPVNAPEVDVFQRSATDLGCVPDGAADFVFMDPPFGSNIFYADSSLLWEAWLGTLTDRAEEIVVNGDAKRVTAAKDLSQYGALMGRAFEGVARIIRADGRAVLAFSNSDDEVWEAIQDALSDSRLEVQQVHLLDKGQPSIKGVKGGQGKERVTQLDLMLALRKTRRTKPVERRRIETDFVSTEVKAGLAAGGGRTDELYSSVLRSALTRGYSVRGITMPVAAAACEAQGAISEGGRWTSAHPPAEGTSFIAGYLTSPKYLPLSERKEAVSKPPVTRAVPGGRGSAAYLAHSYHTKVPPESISPFLEHFTRPGDVVLDPFCGSGMTGLAAISAGRRAILTDLSPAAIHLAWNYTHECDGEALGAAFARIEQRIGDLLGEIYTTTDVTGEPARIHWMLWSTRHRCPSCAREFALWDAIDRRSGRIGRANRCPMCKAEHLRRQFQVVGNEPVWVAFERADGSRGEKPADKRDISRALSFSRAEIEAWWPAVPLGGDREMYQRCALHLHGVKTVADLYTPRNLRALALIWREIQTEKNERLKRALAFAFTNTAWHGTRMRRFNARGGQRPLTGTLYVPQLSSEANVLEVMRNKIAHLKKYYAGLDPGGLEPAIMVESATRLSNIADKTIDYVFTDPPFGSNIFYADCNLVWEAWLGTLTDVTEEAVVNRSLPKARGGKDLVQYGTLMGTAMKQIARVLKPGGWATIVFHNTDAAVWSCIREAAASAGFEFHEASSLDRKQQSHKGYKGRSGTEDVAHFDVVMNLRRPLSVTTRRKVSANGDFTPSLKGTVAEVMRDENVARRGVQGIHAEVMRRLVSTGAIAFPNYASVRSTVEQIAKPMEVPKRRAGSRRG